MTTDTLGYYMMPISPNPWRVELPFDGENRLIEIRPASPQQGDIRTRFAYDYMGRRVRKLAHQWCEVTDPECELQQDGWETEPVEDLRFIYDGWNLVMERTCAPDCEAEVVRAKYAWGLDLSGLYGGGSAGGIGGLLAMEYHGFEGFAEQPKFLYFYDGNGNVGQVVTVDSGTPVPDPPEPVLYLPEGDIASRYEYDPYGGTLLADDPLALNNPFRFSTKHYDAQPATAGERGALSRASILTLTFVRAMSNPPNSQGLPGVTY